MLYIRRAVVKLAATLLDLVWKWDKMKKIQLLGGDDIRWRGVIQSNDGN